MTKADGGKQKLIFEMRKTQQQKPFLKRDDKRV